MTVADIARSCLAYPNVSVADAPTVLPTGAWTIRNCIWGALSEMYERAPALFLLPRQGGTLEAPLSTTVTGAYDQIVADDILTPRGSFCTVRIDGQKLDHRIVGFNKATGVFAEIEPESLSVLTDTPCKVFHDAYEMRVTTTFNVYKYTLLRLGNRAWINGELITRVADREQARAQLPRETGRNATGTPLYWWHESFDGQNFCCVYPMPTEAVALTVEVFWNPLEIPEAEIYTSTKTFELDEQVRRGILLPLVIEQLMGSPLFANPRCTVQVEKNATAARRRLDDVAPKRPPEPDFCPPRRL